MNDKLTTAPKPFCFVLMPFSSDFDNVYKLGIKSACEDVDVYCERVDEQIYAGQILERIYNQIASADIIVADMTGRNPNVFYEVGYAHALGKKTILLTQKDTDIPFDLKHFPHIIYGGNIENLKKDLSKRVKFFAFESSSSKQYESGLEIFLGNKALSVEPVEVTYDEDLFPSIILTIHNRSALTYQSGEFRVGVIAPNYFNYTRTENIQLSKLPSGEYQHMLPVFETLFPGGYCPLEIELGYRHIEEEPELPRPIKIIIRIYSEAGTRDYPLTICPESKVKYTKKISPY